MNASTHRCGSLSAFNSSARDSLTLQLPQLTLITDTRLISNEALFQQLEIALKAGLDAVLIREKAMDSARLLAFSSRVRKLTQQYQSKLIIHSQADIARAIGADGIHLASNDMHEIPDIQAWLQNENMSISTSCHNAEELQQASFYGADFAFLSPVFPTQCHPDAPDIGKDNFILLAQSSPLPVIALGGIDIHNRKQLKDHPVAVIRSLWLSNNPVQDTQLLRHS